MKEGAKNSDDGEVEVEVEVGRDDGCRY